MGKGKKTITTKETTGLYPADCFDNVKKSFDGLLAHVAKLPDGKDKIQIQNWVAGTYLATSEAILTSVSRMFNSPAHA